MLIDLSKALDILELKLLPRLIVHHLDLNHLQMKQVYRHTHSLNLRMNHLLNGNISYFDGTRLEFKLSQSFFKRIPTENDLGSFILIALNVSEA